MHNGHKRSDAMKRLWTSTPSLPNLYRVSLDYGYDRGLSGSNASIIERAHLRAAVDHHTSHFHLTIHRQNVRPKRNVEEPPEEHAKGAAAGRKVRLIAAQKAKNMY